jgi:hypothetical protein
MFVVPVEDQHEAEQKIKDYMKNGVQHLNSSGVCVHPPHAISSCTTQEK